jgi:hypothetical protein
VAVDLDDLAANKHKYPNLKPNDPSVEPDVVVARWLLIALTRAVHTLVITLRDPESDIALFLRGAIADRSLPQGVVEWVSGECLARTLAPTTIRSSS